MSGISAVLLPLFAGYSPRSPKCHHVVQFADIFSPLPQCATRLIESLTCLVSSSFTCGLFLLLYKSSHFLPIKRRQNCLVYVRRAEGLKTRHFNYGGFFFLGADLGTKTSANCTRKKSSQRKSVSWRKKLTAQEQRNTI